MSVLRPLRDRVLVRLEALTEHSSGKIAVVRLERQPSTRAVVVAVGDEVRETAPGKRVVVSRLQGIEVGDCVLLPEQAVLANVVDDAAPDECWGCGGPTQHAGRLCTKCYAENKL